MAAHISQAPVPLGEKALDVPPALAHLIMQCLEKMPDERPASASAILSSLDDVSESGNYTPHYAPRNRRNTLIVGAVVASALVAVGTYASFSRSPDGVVATARNSVAVLPFADDRADSTNEYFGEGIADELMTALAKVPGVRVASRTSSIAVGKRSDLDVREIGRLLGVSTVVEGTVRRSGGQLRVTAQLTNAADGLALWSESYEREGKDVFAVQDDIARAILAALQPELGSRAAGSGAKAGTGTGTTNAEAYDLYLRGIYLLERRGMGVVRAAEYFSEAIKKDDKYARAYAGLASALALYPFFTGVPAHRVEARLRVAAERSLELDPSLSEPRVALAIAHSHALRWNEADAEFQRAIAADSASSAAHLQYGRFLLSRGQTARALEQFRILRALDPLGGTSAVWLAVSLGYSGDHARAWEESKRARELDPNLATAHTFLAFERINAGRLDQARQIVGDGKLPIVFSGQAAYVLYVTGDTARAGAIRRELEATSDTVWYVHTSRAFAYLGMRDTSRALAAMERAMTERELLVQTIPFIDPAYDPLRKSARFAAIVRKAGLEGSGLAAADQ
jgi:serine/threonine-protein kinase